MTTPDEPKVPPTDAKAPGAEAATPAAKGEPFGRRDWLKSAVAAGVAVAGVASLARAEAQESPAPTKEPAAPGPDPGKDLPTGDDEFADSRIILTSKFKGNSKLADFKDGILVQQVSFSSSAHKTGKGVSKAGGVSAPKLSIEQSPVSVEMSAGKWVAELQQACYDGVAIGDIVIAQLGATVDKNPGAKPTVLQKITLTNAVVTSIQHGWDNGDGPRSISISFSFDKIRVDIGTRPADFTLQNITAKAV